MLEVRPKGRYTSIGIFFESLLLEQDVSNIVGIFSDKELKI